MRCLALPLLCLGLLAACEDAPPPWCEPRSPLQLSCPGPHCVAAVVIDYKRLEPRGFRLFTLEGAPIDEKDAQARALAHVKNQLGAPDPDQVEVRRDLGFFNVYLHYNDSGDSFMVILHAQTGQLLFAGLEIWADPLNRGYDFPLPEGFKGPEPLGCQAAVHDPVEKKLVTTGSPTGTAPASTAAEAWDVAQRLNLTARFIGDRPYQALVVSYAPAVGEFDPESADWYVWLYRL